jgi:hypothetical protein
MAQVPNTTTFCFTDVQASIGGTCLTAAISNANSCGGWDANYCGTKTCLLNFRNYNPTQVQKCVNILNVTCIGNNAANSYATGCLCTNPAMSSGEFYCPTFNWRVFNDTYCGSLAIYCVFRNGVCFMGCNASQGETCYGSISFCVPYGDVICLCTRARVFTNNTSYPNEACLYLSTVSGCANFCIYASDEREQYSYTCGSIV